MIPLRDQEVIRERFRTELAGRVRIDYFTQRVSPLYVPGRQDCVMCEQTKTLLEELGALSDRVSLAVHELSEAKQQAAELGVDRVPGIVLRGQANRSLRYFGIPSGSVFPDFIETIIEASGTAPALQPETLKQLRKLKTDVRVQVLVAPTCPYCPAEMRTAYRLALQSPRVKVEVTEITEFPQMAQRFAVRAVPTTVIDDQVVLTGALDEATLLQVIMRAAEGRTIQAGEAKTGPATVLQQPQQQGPVPSPGSGLILPR